MFLHFNVLTVTGKYVHGLAQARKSNFSRIVPYRSLNRRDSIRARVPFLCFSLVMEKHELAFKVGETIAIGSCYILTSAGLITFNKYLMQRGHFPHALQLTALHMSMTTLFSLILCTTIPSIYPSMSKAKENWKQLSKFMLPLGILFAVALFASNKAYFYSSVAFLQFCKQGNVAIIFFASCAIGLQQFSWIQVMVLSIVILGCSLSTTGEIHFVMTGLILQLVSQVSECAKNLIGEVVLTGAGLKLDVLTFVAFQAPFSLVPLMIGSIFLLTAEVMHDFARMWPVLLLNAMLAFALNVLIAVTLKRLSALSFVLIGLLKDITIVTSSALIFGDAVSQQQMMGFGVTMIGIAAWSSLKMAAQKEKEKEKQPIVEKDEQNS